MQRRGFAAMDLLRELVVTVLALLSIDALFLRWWYQRTRREQAPRRLRS
jgi:hypothetical protein